MLSPDDLRELAYWLRHISPRADVPLGAEELEIIANAIEQDRKDGHKLARAFNRERKVERAEQRSALKSPSRKVERPTEL